jgi:hypothetical protein
MEINMEINHIPKPTLGSIKPGRVFVRDEKGLHDTSLVAYMKVKMRPNSLDDAFYAHEAAVRMDNGEVVHFKPSVQVTPVKAVLNLEVPIG